MGAELDPPAHFQTKCAHASTSILIPGIDSFSTPIAVISGGWFGNHFLTFSNVYSRASSEYGA